MEVTFAEDHIRFGRYDFPGATVHPAGTVTPAQIRDADWTTIRPEIRTRRGETLFVPKERQSELERFCHRNGVARQRRPDIWADLLEPFLDTRFPPEAELATDLRLHEAGLTPSEIVEIRERLGPLMHAYNFSTMLWEWAYLGQYDVLNAVICPLVGPALRASVGDPATFYTWTMAIADRPR